MPNYDFHILQPIEFEDLSRDILQAREHITVESFAEGRDGGIDCRFAYAINKTAIVQCKRYADYTTLLRDLKKEEKKVRIISPKRYIITTSVSLTANNKNEIKKLFSPLIIKDIDILGREDLNNALLEFPHIEQRHYKLWMSSTSVLQHVLHQDIESWGDMEITQAKEELRKYVETDSFYKALSLLNDNHFVIISGIPGIGKTTLARMLVLYFLEKKICNDFVWITGDIGEALQVRHKESGQIIFFDDFMGKNYFERDKYGFDKKISMFIKSIKKEKNVWLILSTREYILQEAKMVYDKQYLDFCEESKCILDMNEYGNIIKGRIIYNHFYAAQIPVEYGLALYKNKSYLKLIYHPNFNPRLIETLVKNQIWKTVSANMFVNKLLDFFDKPYSVWEQAYEHLDPLEQYSLLFLATTPDQILIDDWKLGMMNFCTTHREYNLQMNDIKWCNLLRKLERSFIRISKVKMVENEYIVSFINPSMLDFITAYIRDNNLIDILLKLVFYVEQLYTIFCDCRVQHTQSTRITITNKHQTEFVNISKCILKSDRTCAINKLRIKNSLFVRKNKYYPIEIFNDYLCQFGNLNKELNGFIEAHLPLNEFSRGNIDSRLDIILKLDWGKMAFTRSDAMTECKDDINTIEHCNTYINIALLTNNVQLVQSSEFFCKLNKIIYSDLNTASSAYECELIEDAVMDIDEILSGWDSTTVLNDISLKQGELENIEEDEKEELDYNALKQEGNEESKLDEIFSALCFKSE